VARAKATGAARVADLPRRPQPRPAHPDAVVAGRDSGLLWQVVAFGLIGLASTAATALLYAVLRSWSPPLLANLAALVITTVLNTEANRRLTFAGADGSPRRVHLQALVVFGLYYALTSGALLTLQALVAQPSRWLEVAVLLLASVVGTAGRFVLLRTWVFREKAHQNGKEETTA
jgi:putative flippase GtrA